MLLLVSWTSVLVWSATALLFIKYTRNYFHNGFNKYPAPKHASFTNWWRFFCVARKKAHAEYLKLHNDLGDVVRLGPNTLSFADPQAIKDIYGLSRKLQKVRSLLAGMSSDLCFELT